VFYFTCNPVCHRNNKELSYRRESAHLTSKWSNAKFVYLPRPWTIGHVNNTGDDQIYTDLWWWQIGLTTLSKLLRPWLLQNEEVLKHFRPSLNAVIGCIILPREYFLTCSVSQKSFAANVKLFSGYFSFFKFCCRLAGYVWNYFTLSHACHGHAPQKKVYFERAFDQCYEELKHFFKLYM